MSSGRGRGRPILGQGSGYPDQTAMPYQPYHNNMNYNNQAPPPPMQGAGQFSVTSSSLSVHAAEFVPGRSFAPPAPQPVIPATDPMQETQKAITVVTMSPADYESVMIPLTQSLSTSVLEESMLTSVVDLIVDKGISEPNFRYTAARMCGYLSSHLTCQFQGGNFRQYLLKRCHSEHKKREELMADDCRRHILIGFTLFMGELFLNVTVGTDQQHMKVLSTALQELLATLMSTPTEPSLSCVVQVLKLTGAQLEDSEEESTTMDSLFSRLKKNIVESEYRRSTKRQLLSVVELRASRWGRSNEPAPAPAPPTPTEAVVAGGVYYGDDGQTYTYEDASFPADPAAEEAAVVYHFEQQNAYPGIGGSDPGYPQWQSPNYYSQFSDSWSSQDGMDDDVAAAYDEFLVWQQQTLNNAANKY